MRAIKQLSLKFDEEQSENSRISSDKRAVRRQEPRQPEPAATERDELADRSADLRAFGQLDSTLHDHRQRRAVLAVHQLALGQLRRLQVEKDSSSDGRAS